MDASGLLIVVATYNEIENLPKLVEAIFQQAADCRLLVIDDNSPDGTGKWCVQAEKVETRLTCLHRPGKLGLGSATFAGFRHAVENGYQYVLTMDADFSHDPAFIPAIVTKLVGDGQLDVVVGSRYVSGGQIEGWSRHRRIMSSAINTFARCMLGLSVADCSGAFRCYRVRTLEQLNFDNMTSSGYSYLEEILWRLSRAGARFTEVPIRFVDRQRGQTKINWREAASAVLILSGLGIYHQLSSLVPRKRERTRGGV